MKNAPTITIITAVYNGADTLEQTINSVLGQTYRHLQYIVIDGGSTDGSVEIIKKHAHRLHYWVSEKDKGVYHAWNKGVARATGEWIGFLGADDFLLNQHVVEECVKDLQTASDRQIRYVYGKVNVYDRAGKELQAVWGRPWEESKKKIFEFMSVTHCGAFHHASLFTDYGNFNESFRITGDYEFILREFAHRREAQFINRSIVAMRNGGLSDNIRFKLTVAKENIKALELNHFPVSYRHKIQLYKAMAGNLVLKCMGAGTLEKVRSIYKKVRGKK